ncbi:alpha-crystallin B chain isoform X1 [Apis laboriosa]|uniref:Alpha-crystallin B chain isoform X1 n=2 Tax=Apis TaxID=7459 RepID=A0A7M7R4W5_APIME|nr:alpha-crystallin B chain isoform X1 [Apis dorsata]XP_016921821.1 alpha-crystallin B chain isoform X1 [Apis cerana]XP_043800304.1 alpha-crystallin B chain isoform X1 [Apis laboriosa]XP_392405.3 alpha-crystallin B chain isoform X1 [Apis mellifera]KAG6796599.1 alpha-crystallin B chain isoform X1 [Apis mellifera caucasica]KAG9436361.1 alpha-crystallin B chain isoform X1 [Apis mellifera carnica]|eukprot:XP_392405.3 alpha-crystallin B chain isoform X1 [Apis mellifera]
MADSGIKRNIPIKLGDFSVIDTEFSNIRERFDAEMRKMEDEMSRFRSELMNRESNNFFKSTTSRHHTSTSEHRTSTTSKSEGWDKVDPAAPPTRSAFDSFKSTTTQSTQNSSLSPPHDSAWLDGLNSPLIQDEGDSKCLKLRFDVSQYTPEEIVVKTVDNKLLVHAKHEEKTESKSVYREYNREFLLPKGTNPESIKSSLSKDGVLTVEAPLPAIGTGEKLIPIAHQ